RRSPGHGDHDDLGASTSLCQSSGGELKIDGRQLAYSLQPLADFLRRDEETGLHVDAPCLGADVHAPLRLAVRAEDMVAQMAHIPEQLAVLVIIRPAFDLLRLKGLLQFAEGCKPLIPRLGRGGRRDHWRWQEKIRVNRDRT